MGDYGIKVVGAGYNVHTATVLQQTFNSSINTLKIAEADYITSTASGDRTVTFSHGFSYRPGMVFWWDIGGSGNFLTGNMLYNFGEYSAYGYIYDSNISFQLHSNASATIRCFYIILADPAF